MSGSTICGALVFCPFDKRYFNMLILLFRFPCCGKTYPCDVCHDDKEDHEMKFANRMICGFCCKEQVYNLPCMTTSSVPLVPVTPCMTTSSVPLVPVTPCMTTSSVPLVPVTPCMTTSSVPLVPVTPCMTTSSVPLVTVTSV